MKLKAYREKRNFKETPEPSIGKAKKYPSLQFVVQEHHASHLHYDFRLEMEGVLKSWAIPKGPSMNPKEKRLAIMVEDHPYAYKDFAGEIPKGNYGAGIVKIWDKGTYSPAGSSAENPEKLLLSALKKGHISIVLHGKKLKGEFSLVKLSASRSKKDNAWLLIKKADNPASPSKKKLNHTLDTLATAPKAPMLRSIHPMLAKLVPTAFDSPDWAFEIKWDGFRILAYINSKKVELISRSQKDYTEIFEKIALELSRLNIKAIFDGEVVVTDTQGRSSFQRLQQYQKSGIGNLLYYVFDILWLDGRDLRVLSFLERRNILQDIFQNTEHVHISEEVRGRGKDFFNLAAKNHLEGIMAKKISSPYQDNHRSADWLKIKTHLQQEAVICGYTEPRGSRKNFGALILGVYENKTLTYIGHTGTGFDTKALVEMKNQLDKFTSKQCPFNLEPKTNAPTTWMKPHLVADIKFSDWTQDGMMRHPVFIGLREDKALEEVTREKFAELPTHKGK